MKRLEALLRMLAHHRRKLAAGLAIAFGAVAAGAVLFAWLGVYNVAASAGHWDIVDRFLRFGMVNSVKARAPVLAAATLRDPGLIRLGAAHFHGGCAYCHGAPGIPISPIAKSMLPPPPDLAERVAHWKPGELFWIVKHGIKYAGMPAWPALERDDEVLALTAFLLRLPKLDEAAYRALAFGEVAIEPQGGREIANGETAADAVGACARCHGAERPPTSDDVPLLHGQPREVIANALRAYASGERRSGIMQSAASGLSAKAIEDLADFYARLPSPSAPPPGRGSELGREIAERGLPATEIPPCRACHNDQALPLYPRLDGQSERYLRTQLKALRGGANSTTPTGTIMTAIAKRLNDTQIDEVARFLAATGSRDISAQ